MSSIIGAIKSKTIGFSVAVMALGLLEQFTNIVPNLVPPQYSGLAVAGIGVVTAVLRFKTNTALADK